MLAVWGIIIASTLISQGNIDLVKETEANSDIFDLNRN